MRLEATISMINVIGISSGYTIASNFAFFANPDVKNKIISHF